MRKSNVIEVGNTEGKKELRNAILGTVLGLVAGILTYAMIKGGVLSAGHIIPNLNENLPSNIGLSILWAVASGFCSEKVFDRMRGVTFSEG